MTVIHLEPVSNYEKCLLAGGRHTFEITIDEMPSLEDKVPPGQAVIVPFEDEPADGNWHRIARTLNEKGATCIYRRTSAGVYRVLCMLPQPRPALDRQR